MISDSPHQQIEQEGYARQWLDERTRFKSDFSICLYILQRYVAVVCDSSRFLEIKGAFLPLETFLKLIIPDEDSDVAILEELEHLNYMVIRLSAATQDYPNSIICDVHGVNPKFLEIGKIKLEQQHHGNQAFTKGAYYIGKMVRSRGY
ncbi:hypothetical protein PanWU01x14_240630 [Parasponia andersonii]|uniref:Uncharacterized protein n=1 Tax=Parasponia andersonii TaxID=3476 RepID=A0A2P5BGR4_PARAD|nr:hypothetical protein PanWU01x14_240630 [Parasponia andersonii]